MMSFIRTLALNLKISIESLRIFKVRTALALSGVLLGTISTIIVTTISLSLQRKTEESLSSLGENLLVIRSGFTRSLRASNLMSDAMTLTVDDANAIRTSSPLIRVTVPAVSQVYPVRFRDTTLTDALVFGTTGDFFALRGYELEKGSYFYKEENLEKVAVIGSTVAQELFSFEEPLGKYIFINRLPCKVIGVLSSQGVDLSGADQDNTVIIPLQTYVKRLINIPYINLIYVQSYSLNSLSELKKETEALLRTRHHIKRGQNPDFTVVDMRDVAALQAKAFTTVKTLGLIAASVSFTISTLGIFSIMILMVNERKIEIGLRRAVGSKKKDILFQFLLESSFIALTGGIIGITVGPFVSLGIIQAVKLPFTLSVTGIVTAVCAAACVGIISGIYPGLKASKINPVDILQG